MKRPALQNKRVGVLRVAFRSRILEGLTIQQLKPSLNRQIKSHVTKLFPTGIN